ncbi:MAG: hypothetical protein Q9182_006568 [Xanthomendoza sp. 2 TL-2023]
MLPQSYLSITRRLSPCQVRRFGSSLAGADRSALSKSTEAPTHKQGSRKRESKDQRLITSSHDLYALHTSSPGSPLFQPYGTHILQKLQAFLRAQYPSYGFQEVLSPTIYKKGLWEISGHWDNYKDAMFAVTARGAQGGHDPGREIGEDEDYGLKPMNCPGHCLLFKSHKRSYKDLPIRYADFSPLHRNELSGALSGLTRLRRFHQDDGHIFCRPSQIKHEIARTLDFVHVVYQTFRMGDYRLRLGTRPEQFIGTAHDWDQAEARLKMALEESGQQFYINHGDGAFYGPKIDIVLADADGKDHQTATIQLDFQLPKRFELEYDAGEMDKGQLQSDSSDACSQTETPVLIHRAILGSLERFLALLMESDSGRWPFWINPRQLIILTVGSNTEVRQQAEEMARQLASPDAQNGAQTLRASSFMVECDNSDESIAKKIVNARKRNYSFYAVVGERNLGQSIEKQTLDVSVGSLPKQSDVRQVLETLLQFGGPASSSPQGATSTRLTLQQCQRFLKELELKYM